jgi:SAM-dependent methyltransferase
MTVYQEADLYGAAFSWPLDAEVAWLLGAFPGARTVLEPFCGNARYAPHFAARGLEYHGVDLSAEMLARAPKGPRIHLHRADACDFRVPGVRFDLAWCPVNSIRHLVAEDAALAHLRRVREHLAPGGAYVVELELVRADGPWTWRPEHGGEWTQPLEDGAVVEARWRRESCDLAARTCLERAHFRRVTAGRVVAVAEHAFTMRMWTYDDLLRLVAAAGLGIAAVHAWDDAGRVRPEDLAPAAENDGQNRYYVLSPVAG